MYPGTYASSSSIWITPSNPQLPDPNGGASEAQGYIKCDTTPGLFYNPMHTPVSIIAVWVDDFITACGASNLETVKHDMSHLGLEMVYKGPLSYCLGIEFNVSDGVVTMAHRKYIGDLLDRFNMSDCNTRLTHT